MKEEYRCASCRALLFRAQPGALAGEIEVKCRRCRQINSWRPSSPSRTAQSDP
ncbi:Com family DNA-binding transcriptional regulator [Erythrobacter colymbi]|uniref:Com family DNA-binding transcriptional regulator n=1 Tax=Erythrobacter colymbi TaxID=1161202 RepID=UPI000A3A7BBA